MPRIKYEDINLGPDRVAMIAKVNTLIADYRAQGYSLTLRQVYYQFVARDWLPASWADKETGSVNNERSYKKLGCLVNDGRMAGLIDWHSIEDRTRNIDGNAHWDNPQSILDVVAKQFAIDKWDNQPNRVEVWVEKDALEGVVGKAAKALDVQFFSCRGYTSQTAMWDAGQRLKIYAGSGQVPVIIHLGDHDPSGLDMSRDIEDRLRIFMGKSGPDLVFERIALNMDQVEQYTPPPNPTKLTDSRAGGYLNKFGEECWELDALDPTVIDELVTQKVLEYRDEDLFERKLEDESTHRELLIKTSKRWPDVTKFLTKGGKP